MGGVLWRVRAGGGDPRADRHPHRRRGNARRAQPRSRRHCTRFRRRAGRARDPGDHRGDRMMTTPRSGWRTRRHAGWWAFAVHRVSGVALALFLPLHFWVLSQALGGAAALYAVLAWTDQPLVRPSEVMLVLFLAVHLTGGVRLLIIEFGGWRESWQPTAIAVAGGAATLCALVFALNLG